MKKYLLLSLLSIAAIQYPNQAMEGLLADTTSTQKRPRAEVKVEKPVKKDHKIFEEQSLKSQGKLAYTVNFIQAWANYHAPIKDLTSIFDVELFVKDCMKHHPNESNDTVLALFISMGAQDIIKSPEYSSTIVRCRRVIEKDGTQKLKSRLVKNPNHNPELYHLVENLEKYVTRDTATKKVYLTY